MAKPCWTACFPAWLSSCGKNSFLCPVCLTLCLSSLLTMHHWEEQGFNSMLAHLSPGTVRWGLRPDVPKSMISSGWTSFCPQHLFTGPKHSDDFPLNSLQFPVPGSPKLNAVFSKPQNVLSWKGSLKTIWINSPCCGQEHLSLIMLVKAPSSLALNSSGGWSIINFLCSPPISVCSRKGLNTG